MNQVGKKVTLFFGKQILQPIKRKHEKKTAYCPEIAHLNIEFSKLVEESGLGHLFLLRFALTTILSSSSGGRVSSLPSIIQIGIGLSERVVVQSRRMCSERPRKLHHQFVLEQASVFNPRDVFYGPQLQTQY